MSNTALSIVLVTANDQLRLESTLESFLGIKLPIELIVVHPSSDQCSKVVISKYRENILFQLKEVFDQGIGIYSAMNLGAEAATGRYLTFWNSGDLADGTAALSSLCSVLQESSEHWLISQGAFDWRPAQKLTLENLLGFVTHASECFISHQTTFFSRKAFLAAGAYDNKYKVAADTKIITRFFLMYTPQFIHFSTVVVEAPNFASTNNRLGRKESILISVKDLPWALKWQSVKNFFFREIGSIFSKKTKSRLGSINE